MTGPEHFQEAERLLAELPGLDMADPMEWVARAQVHATLAHAAATALMKEAPLDRDWSAWYNAAGTKPVKDTYADEGATE